MNKAIDIILVVGFVAVDVFFFHDIFKAGESTSLPQYLTGLLSIPVMVRAIWSLARPPHSAAS